MFNTIAVTLPPALRTGNLEVRTDSVCARVRMNNENQAQGVTYIERFTNKSVDADAKYVLLAASTLENTRCCCSPPKADSPTPAECWGTTCSIKSAAAASAGSCRS